MEKPYRLRSLSSNFNLFGYVKGHVCTRNQIIEDVWDIHFDYDTGVIDVFINAIRKKLNLKREQDYIKTIRGVGYIPTIKYNMQQFSFKTVSLFIT
jgi:DNA-binding winged helix-turn-helix (wHTH) protein